MIADVSIIILPDEEQDKSLINKEIKKALQNKGINITGKKYTSVFVKKSIDARRGKVKLFMKYKVYIGEEPPASLNSVPEWKKADSSHTVIIIGSGPAGLYGAFKLLEYGIKPVIIERGSQASDRKRDIASISTKGIVGDDSNYCFGEGGAGTFSDGKLYTRSNKRGDISSVLRIFNHFGADSRILTDAHPHIGTDRLPAIVKAMREKIIEKGGEFYFDTRLTDFITEKTKNGLEVKGVRTKDTKTGEEKTFLSDAVLLATGMWIFGVIICSSLLLTLLGLFSALTIKLPRIPITIEKVNELPAMDLKPLLTKLFPYSGFDALHEASYLLPCFILAGFIGAAATNDKPGSKAAMAFFDSMAKIMQNVMVFFTEVLSVGIIAIMTKWTLDFISTMQSGVYTPLVIMLAGDLMLVAFVIYPLVLRFLCHDPHPYKVIYASITPFLVAFFSGDTNLTIPVSMRHGKESLGINNRVNAVTYPLFGIFARGGAALAETVCFILILRSYSSLNISLPDCLWIAGISLLLSFTLGEIPSGGPFFATTIMCFMYGKGFEAGYLLLKSAAPIICAFAAGFDALTAMVGSYIVAVKTKSIEHQEVKNFI